MLMNKKVCIGVVGTSDYTDVMHLAAIESHDKAKVTAICGRNYERTKHIANKYQIAKTYSDYNEMIKSGDLDAVIISTPDALHHPITMAALDANLHVLCEKPLAKTLLQAEEMFKKASSKGLINMTYFTWRWMPHCELLHQLITENYLGKCFHADLQYLSGYGRDGEYKWRWDPEHGLGVLSDLGSHMIYLAQWYLGDIVRVNAQLNTFVEKKYTDGKIMDAANDSAVLQLIFESGAHVNIHVSGVAHVAERMQEQKLVLHGDAGMIEAHFEQNKHYRINAAKTDQNEIINLNVPDSILQGISPKLPIPLQRQRIFTEKQVGTRLFIDSIINNKTVRPNFYDGYKVQQIIDAALRSNKQSSWIAID